ncbi:NAD-dependent epimerase/dehydratase family protein, partial [Pseudochelatococcus sp. B33]
GGRFMRAVITGGAGYIGTLLACELARQGTLTGRSGAPEPLDSLIVIDPAIREDHALTYEGAKLPVNFRSGSVTDREFLQQVIREPGTSVFHLASVLTGVTERDIATALSVNVDGTRNLLEILAELGEGSRMVMTSSVTVYRRDAEDAMITDKTATQPRSVYGLTKLISENLVSAFQHMRKVDGRCARLSTVVIRPKKIGTSAGAAISDVLRDVVLGRDCEICVSEQTRTAFIDYESCVKGLIRLHEVEQAALEDNPVVNFPALTASLEEMIAGASAIAGKNGYRAGRASFKPEPFAQNTIDSWPTVVDGARAEALGIRCKPTIEQICQDFVQHYHTFWAQVI